MTTNIPTKATSRIIDAVHDTASDLHRLGFIDNRKMSKFDALCLDQAPDAGSERIHTLRQHQCGSRRG